MNSRHIFNPTQYRFRSAHSTNYAFWHIIRDKEAVKFLMLPVPASLEVLCFRVRFRFQSLSLKCFRFHKNLIASTASAFTSLFVTAATC